ncbi:unnamed protein product [Caenorhabditis brenneri]
MFTFHPWNRSRLLSFLMVYTLAVMLMTTNLTLIEFNEGFIPNFIVFLWMVIFFTMADDHKKTLRNMLIFEILLTTGYICLLIFLHFELERLQVSSNAALLICLDTAGLATHLVIFLYAREELESQYDERDEEALVVYVSSPEGVEGEYEI